MSKYKKAKKNKQKIITTRSMSKYKKARKTNKQTNKQSSKQKSNIRNFLVSLQRKISISLNQHSPKGFGDEIKALDDNDNGSQEESKK